MLSASGSWFNHPGNTSFNAIGEPKHLFVQFPTLEYDSYLTIGASSSNTPSSQHPSSAWGDIVPEFDGNGSGFNVTVNDATGGIWFSPFPGIEEADSHPGFAGDDLRVLLMQMTTSGSISGQIQVQIFQNGDQDEEVREVFLYDSEYHHGLRKPDPCDGIIDACGCAKDPAPFLSAAARYCQREIAIAMGTNWMSWVCVAARAFKTPMATANAICTRRMHRQRGVQLRQRSVRRRILCLPV